MNNKFDLLLNCILSVIVMVWLLFSSGFAAAQNQSRSNTTHLFISVSNTNNNYLVYSDGTPYIPIGPNICWPRFVTSEKEGLAKMQNYIEKLRENHCNYTRIWLSAPFFDIEEKSAGIYDSVKMMRVDSVINMASRAGIKVKLCIEYFRDLTNKPASFPGSVPFGRPFYAKINGGPIENMTQFFSSLAGKNLYIRKLQFLAKRYGQNSAIYGWELWNEINAVNVDEPLLFDWTSEMLKEAKKIFPNHLVMQSLGSFDGESSKEIYPKYMRLSGNEIAQVHRYLDPGAKLDVCKGDMDILAASATRELRSYNPQKPILVSEIGAVEANHSGPSLLYDIDTKGILLHDMLFAPFFSGAAGPGQSWHWDFYIEKNNLWWHFDRFYQVVKNINPVSESLEPFFMVTNSMRIYGLKGKHTTLLWCRDSNSNWSTELVNKIVPSPLVNQSLALSQIKLINKQISKIDFFDPWLNKWSSEKSNAKQIDLPPFIRSLVVRIKY
ncbi:MAG: cellulase family glycosylhydrolase [Mariniphaga sp.]